MLLFDETPETPRPLSVGELSAQIKDLLEAGFPSIWVAGEISNLARPASGHIYLTLKDEAAQLKACVWRGNAQRVRFDLHDGLDVICHGHLEVYAPRGQYQLIVHSLEPRGMGALELALRQLRERLAREGLFDPARKRPLPAFVRKIAVVTSPTGAAIRDFLQVLGRRWRGADVLILPTRVQGEGAAAEIAAAIETANRLGLHGEKSIDCLVVTRGGGSLEDLWSFNEEPVVRAIAASKIPVISAIGHEIDVTLADLAADVRALTPSEAAELIAPAAEELAAGLRQMRKRLTAALRSRAAAARANWERIARHPAFRRPHRRIFDLSRRLDELDARSKRALRQRMTLSRRHLDKLSAQLDSLGPLAVLKRGYSITLRAADGRAVRSSAELQPGEEIVTRFAAGRAASRVEKIEE
ncbi:MAG: exodeoxyribonuclease VII large subunit [Pirellulales bacterium]|nr:exodeoxyribonuclease VII large subunit [Pirellulales bacterium]